MTREPAQTAPSPATPAKIIIAICTFKRVRQLESLLLHLATANLDRIDSACISILVVDNLPTGEIRIMIDRIRNRIPVPLELVEEPSRGISHARNCAVDEALQRKCDFIAFIDDDDHPAVDWLCQLIARQQAMNADIILGAALRASNDDTLHVPDDSVPIWREDGLANTLGTGNVMIARSVLERMQSKGPVFDPAFGHIGGEDADFYYRAKLAGARFVRASASRVFAPYSQERTSGRGLFALKFRYGCADAALVRRHLDPAARRKWLGATVRRFLRSLLTTPVRLLRDPRKYDRTLSKLGWPSGALYGFFGGRYGYYGKKER